MTRSTTAMPVFGPPATWRELGSEKNFGRLLEYECGLEEMFAISRRSVVSANTTGTHCPMM